MASETVRFSVPEAELPNLKLLASTPVEILQLLEGALGEEKPTLGPEALSSSLAQRTGLEISVVGPLVSLLFRLALVQRSLELTASAFLEALTTTLTDMGDDKWSAADSQRWAERREQIERVLASQGALAAGAKAAELLLEQQLLFVTSRVVTDVRPVFDEGAERLLGFATFHNLAIGCYEDGKHRTIRIAMDSDDIARLRDQLGRAQRKEKLIADNLTEAGVSVIHTGGEPNA